MAESLQIYAIADASYIKESFIDLKVRFLF